MNKNIIIRTANTLFARYGIETVSIKRIADEAGIPEKAVEAEFNSKEQLVEACLNHEIVKMETAVSYTVLYAQSSLETLVGAASVVFGGLSGFCPAFYMDLKKYPSARQQLIAFRTKFRNNCTVYFRECEQNGFFTPGTDAERTASIYVEEISSLEYRYQARIMRIFLRSICSGKGRKELSRISNENNL